MLYLRAMRVSGFRDEKVAWRRVREGYGAGYGGPLPVLAGRSRCGAGPAALAHGSWLPLPVQPAACCLPVPCRRQRQGLVQSRAHLTGGKPVPVWAGIKSVQI